MWSQNMPPLFIFVAALDCEMWMFFFWTTRFHSLSVKIIYTSYDNFWDM